MKNKYFLVLASLLALAGCSADKVEHGVEATPTGTQVSVKGGAKPVQVSVICPSQPTELADAIKSGTDSATQTLQANDGVKISTVWKPYKNLAELQDALQSAVLNHDQAVLFRPDPQYNVSTQLHQLAEAGIKVITLGIDVKKDQRAVFCGIPDIKLGNRMGYTIATRSSKAFTVAVIHDPSDAEVLKGLKEVSTHYPNLKLMDFPVGQVSAAAVVKTIKSNAKYKSWIVFQGSTLADPEDLASLDAKSTEIFTLGCWPRQLPLLESGLLKPLSLPSYELGYLAMCRAVDIAAFHRKTDDTYMISTPLVDSKSVRTYALTLRRWGFTNIASKYLDTVRSGDNVR